MNDKKIPPHIIKLEERWEKNPDSIIFLKLAEEYRKNDMPRRAIEICREGLERHPNYHSARVCKGQCFLDQGEIQKAKRVFQKVLEASPGNIKANRLLGDIHYDNDNLEEALERYEVVQQLNPIEAEIPELISELRSKLDKKTETKSQEEKVSEAEQKKELEEDTAHIKQKNLEEAKEEFEKGVPLDLDSSATQKMNREEIEAQIEKENEEEFKIFEEETKEHPSEIEEIDAGDLPREQTDLDEQTGEKESIPEDSHKSEKEEIPEEPDLEVPEKPDEPDTGTSTRMDETKTSGDDSQELEIPVETEAEKEEEGEEVISESLARLYERQGHLKKAIKVYERMLVQEPSNNSLKEKIATLNKRLTAKAKTGEESPSESGKSQRTLSKDEKEIESLKDDITELKDTSRSDKVKTLKDWLKAVRKQKKD